MSGKKKWYGDWIRPEVRTPKKGKPVLLSPAGYNTIAVVGYYNDGEFYLYDLFLKAPYPIKVEGWMELPVTISTAPEVEAKRVL